MKVEDRQDAVKMSNYVVHILEMEECLDQEDWERRNTSTERGDSTKTKSSEPSNS